MMRLISLVLLIAGMAVAGFGVWSLLQGERGSMVSPPEMAEAGPGRAMSDPSAGEGGERIAESAPVVAAAPPAAPAPAPVVTGTPAPSLDAEAPIVRLPGEMEGDAGGARSVTIEDLSGAMPEADVIVQPESVAMSMADRIMSQLRTVPIAFETPANARLGRVFDVTLSIDATGAVSAAGALPGRGDVTEGEAKVSDRVMANLVGSGFEIVARSPERQTLSPLEANTWRWEVTARESGTQDLEMVVYALIEDDTLPVRTYTNTVQVEVSTVQQVITAAREANPVFMILGGLGSLLAGFFGMAKFIRDR